MHADMRRIVAPFLLVAALMVSTVLLPTLLVKAAELPQGWGELGYTLSAGAEELVFTGASTNSGNTQLTKVYYVKNGTNYTFILLAESTKGINTATFDGAACAKRASAANGQRAIYECSVAKVQASYCVTVEALQGAGNSIRCTGGNTPNLVFPNLVTYTYTGVVPVGALVLPESAQYGVGDVVTVALVPTLDSCMFSGWTAAGITIVGNSFTKQNGAVTLAGSWSCHDPLPPTNSFSTRYVYSLGGGSDSSVVPVGDGVVYAGEASDEIVTIGVDGSYVWSGLAWVYTPPTEQVIRKHYIAIAAPSQPSCEQFTTRVVYSLDENDPQTDVPTGDGVIDSGVEAELQAGVDGFYRWDTSLETWDCTTAIQQIVLKKYVTVEAPSPERFAIEYVHFLDGVVQSSVPAGDAIIFSHELEHQEGAHGSYSWNDTTKGWDYTEPVNQVIHRHYQTLHASTVTPGAPEQPTTLPSATLFSTGETGVTKDDGTDVAVLDETATKAPVATIEARGISDNRDGWALVNLLLAIFAGTISVGSVVGCFKKRGKAGSRQIVLRVLTVISFIGAAVTFVLTEDTSLPVRFIDEWTLLVLLLAVLSLSLALTARRRANSDNERISRI